MSNYTKTTNFATKDNLSPGNPLKIVKGTEIDTEFNNIATAVATKTDNSAAAITGGSITGITDLAVADGGTGASTAAGALNNLLPSQTSAANKYLQSDGTNASWDAVSLSTADITGTLAVANGGTGVTSSTGTGNVVLSNSPTLVTPALGTPASGTATNLTGLPISTGVSGLGTGVATFLGTPSSANLASAVTDETGSGALVFANSPTLVTPALGTPSALVGTNITGTASGLTAGNVTTNANLTGAVTSVGNATSLGSFSSANLLGALTDETGTGSAVFATSPTLVTPILGTPTSATLTNATGLPIASGVSGLGTGVATALAVNVGSSGAPLVNGGVLGTPSSGTATNLTGLPLSTGVTGTLPVANGGTGTATPSIVAGTNVTVTGTWPNQTIAASGSSGTVTSVAATVPSVFSVSGSPITTSGTLAMTYSGTALPVVNGGTGQTSYTDGQLLIGNSTGNTLTKATLTAGTNVTITNAAGAITIAASGGGASAATPTALGTVYGVTPSTTAAVALGYQAANSATGATGVTAVGYQALQANTANNNTAFGAVALYSNTSATFNSAFAREALYTNTTGANNTAIGPASLFNNNGSENCALGRDALYTNSSGSNNVGLGRSALFSNSTASNNTAVGYQAGYTNSTGTALTAFGANALRSSSSVNNNVGLGDSAGYAATGAKGTFVGSGSGSEITSGAANTILGRYNGNQNSLDIRTLSNHIVLSDGDGNPRGVFDGSGNFLVGSPTNGGQTGVGIFTQTAASDCLTANATNASFTSAIINIRTTRNTTNGTFKAIQYYNDGASAQKFYVIDSGAIYSTSTSITSISDQRFKENIKDIDVGLDAVMALKPRRFDWIDGKGEDRKNAVGFIAQEVQTVLPDLISIYEQSPEDTTEYLAIRQSDLIPTLVKAIQELKAEFDAYKASHP